MVNVVTNRAFYINMYLENNLNTFTNFKLRFYYDPLVFERNTFIVYSYDTPKPFINTFYDIDANGFIGREIEIYNNINPNNLFAYIGIRPHRFVSFDENDYYTQISEYSPLNYGVITNSLKDIDRHEGEFHLSIDTTQIASNPDDNEKLMLNFFLNKYIADPSIYTTSVTFVCWLHNSKMFGVYATHQLPDTNGNIITMISNYTENPVEGFTQGVYIHYETTTPFFNSEPDLLLCDLLFSTEAHYKLTSSDLTVQFLEHTYNTEAFEYSLRNLNYSEFDYIPKTYMVVLAPQMDDEGEYSMHLLMVKFQYSINAFKYRFVYNSDKILIEGATNALSLPISEIKSSINPSWGLSAKFIEFETNLNTDLFIDFDAIQITFFESMFITNNDCYWEITIFSHDSQISEVIPYSFNSPWEITSRDPPYYANLQVTLESEYTLKAAYEIHKPFATTITSFRMEVTIDNTKLQWFFKEGQNIFYTISTNGNLTKLTSIYSGSPVYHELLIKYLDVAYFELLVQDLSMISSNDIRCQLVYVYADNPVLPYVVSNGLYVSQTVIKVPVSIPQIYDPFNPIVIPI